jgi:hypothetical protein
MSGSENPCLSVAIKPLMYGGFQLQSALKAEHFAIWVLKAPCPGAFVHHDSQWPETLTQTWLAWQEMFKLRGLPHVPFVHHATDGRRGFPVATLPPEPNLSAIAQMPYTSRLMQSLGISLWEWLFDGPIGNSLAQSEGIAIGQHKQLRLRLEIRDPDLIPLPWEIMQPQPGKPAISLSQQILFSRTTSDVYPLPPLRVEQALNILVVLGQDVAPESGSSTGLKLKQEADALTNILKNHEAAGLLREDAVSPVYCHVDTLLQPTPAELIDALETEKYNVMFYAGHGVPAPDGGLLFLRPEATLNGTELAQVLVRCRVTLAVFNACWGAQPDQDKQLAIPRSSLAEVLIHHGVPAVLGMRDTIADEEALSFIQTFAQALAERMPIDQAVAVARQQLLTLYKFNQPAWTLPVLYMHPEFDGVLIKTIAEGITELPGLSLNLLGQSRPVACLRSLEGKGKIWQIHGGLMRVGRSHENDLVIEKAEVSRKHAVILSRDSLPDGQPMPTYFLRDESTFGTFILGDNGWQKVHHQEVPLQSGVRLKLGSTQGETLEFIIEGADTAN